MQRNGTSIRFSTRYDSQEVAVPEWVVDQESFRRWADADDFPETGRVCWLRGEVWIDMSREQLFTHGQIKTKFTMVLGTLNEALRLGYYWDDGPLVSHVEADIAVNPDGVFVSVASIQAKNVRLLEGMEEGHVEIEGSPDMVLEVVSRSSVKKDTVILRDAYWKAGVQEYWLVDARQDPLKFDILRSAEQGYVPTRKQKGWVRSQVFGKLFRLIQATDVLNNPVFTLECR